MTQPQLADEDFRRILLDVTYLDWTFKLGFDEARPYLQITFEAMDAKTQRPGHQTGRKWFLSRYMTRSEVINTCVLAVLTAIEHEARENFRYRGRPIYGPHFDVDELWRNCLKEDARQ